MHVVILVYACYATYMISDIPIARRDEIARRLSVGQSVLAATLAVEFGVSEDAIRRDLRALAAEGRCRRVYGGALPVPVSSTPMVARMDKAWDQKEALARAAATTIQRGEFVFLDNGSTNLALVDFLPEDHELTVATNSVDIAAAVLRRADLQLIVIGGAVDTAIGGCIDASAVLGVSKLNIDRCFVGVCAVSDSTGISVFHFADATFKQALLLASRQSTVLVTTDKLDSRAPHRVAHVGEIGLLIVEHNADDHAMSRLQRAGATLLKAKPPI